MNYPGSYRPSSFSMGFDALDNFRLAFCLLVPGGWILAQLLLFLYFYLDNGAETCGVEFQFNNDKEDEITENEIIPLKNREEDAMITSLFRTSVTFKSSHGRLGKIK